MRGSLLICMVAAVALAGCSKSRQVNMYPLQGPITQQDYVPTIAVTANNVNRYSGTMSFRKPNGARCSGDWSSAGSVEKSVTTASLYSRYGSISGVSNTVRNTPGVNRGDGFATCTDGGRFNFEFYTGSGTGRGSGLAVDDEGNVYKMII